MESQCIPPVRWKTDKQHADNSETMQDYLHNENMLDIDIVDGSYAEGINAAGTRFAIRAGGDGDSYNHIVTFEILND